MKKTKTMCLTAVIAAFYVALTLVNPISWSFFQFRISNILCALPFTQKKAAPAILLGIGIANAFSPLGLIDVAFGVSAEFFAYLLIVWGPLKHVGSMLKSIVLSICVALVVGTELWIVYQSPIAVNMASLFLSTLVIVLAGSAVFLERPCKTLLKKIYGEGYE